MEKKIDKRTKILLIVTILLTVFWIASFLMSNGDDLYNENSHNYINKSVLNVLETNQSDNNITQASNKITNRLLSFFPMIITSIGAMILGLIISVFGNRNIGLEI